jgi:hypothetical protein
MITNLPAIPSQDILLQPVHAVHIPATNPEHYISFKYALNLRYPNEDTGDWHFQAMFFHQGEQPLGQKPIQLAGKGEEVNTLPSLNLQGIRDMTAVLIQQGLPIQPEIRVYVANHYRAIADLAMLELQQSRIPGCANNRAINSWLDSHEQIEHLKQIYLNPLVSQLTDQAKEAFEAWIMTIHFD